MLIRYDKCRFCYGDGCLACGGEKARAEGIVVETATWKKRLYGQDAEQLLRDVAAVVPGMSGFGASESKQENEERGPTAADLKLAARFRKWAEAMTVKIEDKSEPMTQNPTPKRVKARILILSK